MEIGMEVHMSGKVRITREALNAIDTALIELRTRIISDCRKSAIENGNLVDESLVNAVRDSLIHNSLNAPNDHGQRRAA
jgi:hypothetical protein